MSSDDTPLVKMDLDIEEAEMLMTEPQLWHQHLSKSKVLPAGALLGSLLLAGGVTYHYQMSSGLLATKADVGAIIEKAEEEGGDERNFGKSECPCIGIDGMKGSKTVKDVGTFPADLGAHCHAWDDEEGKEGKWRQEKWCYVDPCNCKLHVPPKHQTYMPDARFLNEHIYYSYNTCGGEDLWTPEHNPKACPLQKDKKACAAVKEGKDSDKHKCTWNDDDDACVGTEYAGECSNPPEKKYGKKECRCAGIEHQDGKVEFDVDGKKLEYPVDLGATCQDWDAESSNPACQGDSPKEWCKKKWCYVNPCECDLDLGPFVATYGDGKWTMDGRPTYYSYVTCGEKNMFASKDTKNFERPHSCPSSD